CLRAVADPLLRADGNLTGAVYILSDVTAHKALHEQLRQSQKLEALGRLAAGVAHEFNNLLTGITGNIAHLLGGAPKGTPQRESLLLVDQIAWRAVEITRQLLEYARKTAAGLQPTHLGSCLEEVAGLFGRLVGRRITLE